MSDDVPLQATWKAFKTLQYQRYNQRRLEHLVTLGLDLRQRSVLELDAAVGDLTTFAAPTFTRAVFVASYHSQTMPLLVPRIPDHQTRAP